MAAICWGEAHTLNLEVAEGAGLAGRPLEAGWVVGAAAAFLPGAAYNAFQSAPFGAISNAVLLPEPGRPF